MAYYLLLLLLFIVTVPVAVAGVPLIIMASFNRIRRKGYHPLGASLIITAAWGMGALLSGIWGFHRYTAGAFSVLDALEIPYILLFTALCITAVVFFVLPRGNIRVSGHRRVPFSLVRLAWLLGAVWITLSLAIPIGAWAAGANFLVVWMGPILALGSLGLTIKLAAGLRPFDRASEAPLPVEKLLIEDPRPPVFYLRPFKLDYSIFVSDEVNHSFESYLVESLNKLIGPVIALGNPEDSIPLVAGAVRTYANDTDWVQTMDELARRACCMIVEMASSDNLRLEYTHLKREGLQEKLFVFTGHPKTLPSWIRISQRMRFGPARIRWQKFSSDLAKLGYNLGAFDPGPGSVITFDPDGTSIVLTTEADTREGFVEPVRAWLNSREKIGRFIPMRCLKCGREFHEFPADVGTVRDIKCRNHRKSAFHRGCLKFRNSECTEIILLGCFLFGVVAIFTYLSPWIFIPVLGLGLVAGFRVRSWGKARLNARNRKLAENGNAVVMTNLGISQLSRTNESGNAEAANWFSKAAEAGDIGGMINLANMYERGLGALKKDAAQAGLWYKRAGELGSAGGYKTFCVRSVLGY